ncbi:MAG: hypothetical protein IPJ41_12470 [Phycisphaerales bacterium]|nr:hypothetical protein [Phycisphaerales bacterium]
MPTRRARLSREKDIPDSLRRRPPSGHSLVEKAVELDDSLMEKYLEDEGSL